MRALLQTLDIFTDVGSYTCKWGAFKQSCITTRILLTLSV